MNRRALSDTYAGFRIRGNKGLEVLQCLCVALELTTVAVSNVFGIWSLHSEPRQPRSKLYAWL